MSNAIDRLRRMMLIRAFETALAKRADHGFQLLSTGEEAVAVGLCDALNADDQLLTGGRSIGPALARGADPGRVMAELLGKTTGLNAGRAGRGHMADPAHGFFGAHAVVAGNISIAAGVALAKQIRAEPGIVAVQFGDGAAGAGVLHETLNIAAIWRLPLLFVCNNNQLSVSTTRDAALAPCRLSDFGATFGLWARTVDGTDIDAVLAAAGDAALHVRAGEGPAFLECVSVRLRSHSTTARETRSREQMQALWLRCPIRRQAERLALDEAVMAAEAEAEVAAAMALADAAPYPDPADVLELVG
jgi:pyruvate dehydrogenase E1 component alpha subunit